MKSPASTELTRREYLRSALCAGLIAAIPPPLRAADAGPKNSTGRRAVLEYLESLRRDDAGYGWSDQENGHLTPTYAAIGAYRLLGGTPPRSAELAEFVRTHHPQHIKKLEQERRVFDFQQVQALVWLGADASALAARIAAWTQPLAYLERYEKNGYPVMQSELGAVLCHALLGLPVAGIAGAFTAYLEARRRPNGSFNNTPAAQGGDGHVMNTLWALQALRVLGRETPNQQELIGWLRRCQVVGSAGVPPASEERPERPQTHAGGFTFAPRPEFGGVDDVVYTRAAVRALELLGSGPADREGCIRYLHSLMNADGGFGDRPGWPSNAPATYHALDALAALGALDSAWERGRSARLPRAGGTPALPRGLKVFSIQIQAHGQGSPADAVELARALKIDLWGAKNARPGWIAQARRIAAVQRVPVTFFVANEEYGTWVNVPGLGTYSHTSDLVAPADADIGASLANQGVASWPEFREKRLAPLERGGGRLVWQFGENEELVRMFLDDSLERGGYAAISTFHFGNPDFTNTEPFLKRWRGRIPFIALQDAHGPEPWWFADMTTGFRTVFLATEPTWTGWLEALKHNRVVAIRRDPWTRGKTWMHSGSDRVLEFVRARERDWRWWDNPAIARPMVSLVALTPADEFEAGRPESGLAIRVRCAWENTAQGLARQPLSELVRLLVDGREVIPGLIARKRPNGMYEEYCHQLLLPRLEPGKHTATATVHVIATNALVTRTLEFSG
jgi:hypothetical protein